MPSVVRIHPSPPLTPARVSPHQAPRFSQRQNLPVYRFVYQLILPDGAAASIWSFARVSPLVGCSRRKEQRPMDITFNCTKCGQQIAIDEAAAGQLVDCPKCKTPHEVPYESVVPVAVPPTPSAPPQPEPPAALAQKVQGFSTFTGGMEDKLSDFATLWLFSGHHWRARMLYHVFSRHFLCCARNRQLLAGLGLLCRVPCRRRSGQAAQETQQLAIQR